MNVPKLRFKEFDGEWEERKLKDLTESISYGMNASAKEYDGENIYLRITDIDEESRTFIEKGKVSPDGELTEKYLLKENDILFTRTGASTGKSFLFKNEKRKFYFAGFLIRARIKKDVDAKFVYQQTLISKYYKWVKVMSMRSGQPGINGEEYGSFNIFLPSLNEQRRISSFLEIMDKKIQLQQQKIDLLQEQKKGYMQKVFNQELRFKDGSGDYFDEWVLKPLNNIADKISTKNKELKVQNVITNSAARGLISQNEYFEKDIANKNNIEGYYVIAKGDFVYNPRISSEAPCGPVNIYYGEEKGIVSPLYTCFRLKDCHKEFVHQYFKSTLWHKYIYENGDSGARHDRVSIKDSTFFEMPILLPCYEEQQKIAGFFEKFELKIKVEKEKLKELEEQKQGFMQKMFI